MQEKEANGLIELTEEQWYAICDAGAGQPRPLSDFDVSKSFVYDREYGIFPVSPAHHQQVMALLYAFRQGYLDAYDLAEDISKKDGKRRLENSYFADKFLETIPGTAFRSSVQHHVITGFKHSLTPIEKRIFGNQLIYQSETLRN